MARTLQICSWLALIATGIVLISCVRLRGSDTTRRTVSSAIERHTQAEGNRDQTHREQLSPLVKQAQIFATYLNPPPPPKREPSPQSIEVKEHIAVAKDPEIKPARTSAKFKLRGISYRPAKPEESMALIWEPGTGHRWVKKGTQLGHIVISEIDSDSVLCTDGNDTRVMALDLDQTTVTFAKSRRDKPAQKHKQAEKPEKIVAHWAPVRRMRQIPHHRASAKMGAASRETDTDTP